MHTKSEEHNPKLEEAREHMKAARKAFRESMLSWLPPGFVQHRRAARREMLLAMRTLVDAAIDHMEKDAQTPEEPKTAA